MIKLEDVTFTYPGTDKPQLQNIYLEIEQGDFVAIVGNNGCGKSTLCKTLNGLIPNFIVGNLEGNIFINNKNISQQEIGDLATQVGYVYQDFENQILRPTVLDDASFACLNYGDQDYIEKGKHAIKVCGLQEKVNDYIWQLSGGQKHLLALASTLALGPDILILDEPIAQLDPMNAIQIYGLLQDLNTRLKKTIIVIEHHTEFIANYCKHVVLMKEGRIIWKKPSLEALQQIDELQASNVFPPQVTLAAKKMMELGKIESTMSLPTTFKEGKEVFSHLHYHPQDKSIATPHKKQPLMVFRDIDVVYKAVKGKPTQVMKDFSLTINKGEKIALIGSNGAGKSTLMKLMLGCIKPVKGQIELEGIPLKELSFESLAEKVALVYQNPEEMFISDSIKGDIEYAMKAREIKTYTLRTKELLERFQLEILAHRDGRLLSGGQMRRASLAIGIALNPKLLLLDEPTANLDIATRREIIHTLKGLEDITETVIIATHDMQLVCDWAERIIVLHQGRVLADETKDQLFKREEIMYTAGICPPSIYQMGRILHKGATCYTVEDFCRDFEEGVSQHE